jgi:hypothetical protein
MSEENCSDELDLGVEDGLEGGSSGGRPRLTCWRAHVFGVGEKGCGWHLRSVFSYWIEKGRHHDLWKWAVAKAQQIRVHHDSSSTLASE